MSDFFSNIINNVSITDAIDIGILTFVLYKIIGFIKETRAQQLVKGILLLIACFLISDIVGLYTINWILGQTMTVGVIALVVVFQPELRRALEVMGRSKLIKGTFGQINKENAKNIINEFVNSVEYFSSVKLGALLVIERKIQLTDVAESGTIINGKITKELLGNIFYEGAPLHDGAVIIRGERVHAAGCVLPLTNNNNLNKNLGTRHRAGIGITENSDAITIIVSEETGTISIVEDGKMIRYLNRETLEKRLTEIYMPKVEEMNLAQKIKTKIVRK